MTFAKNIVDWQIKFGRHDLPWQINKDPYRILLSEIMLQQTQVSAVIPFFKKFIHRFPSLKILAEAKTDDVMAYWAGLGYYRRAHNLHNLAKIVTVKYRGELPNNSKILITLPGIGRSTASAIACFAFNAHEPILDGNVKRILCRAFMVSGPIQKKSTETALWTLAETLMPHKQLSASAYAQGLMDLGSLVCKRNKPLCDSCPIQGECKAFLTKSQHLFPEKIKRKTLPVKEKTVILFHNYKNIVLQKRPSTGIWSGLWSLPEDQSDCSEEMKSFSKSIPKNEKIHLPIVLHKFTHFHLKIQTIAVIYNGDSFKLKANKSLKQVAWANIQQYGIPSPIKKILEDFYKNNILKN